MPLDNKSLVKIAKALSDPTRLRLLQAIAQAPEVACVDLFTVIAISQPTMSHHLKVLEEAGLLAVRKQGRTLMLTLLPGRLQELTDSLTQLQLSQ